MSQSTCISTLLEETKELCVKLMFTAFDKQQYGIFQDIYDYLDDDDEYYEKEDRQKERKS